MEEIKNEEKIGDNKGCHGHKCCSMMSKCSFMGHKFIKLIMAIFVVILLLSIGAAIGARHSERGYGYGSNGHFGRGGCGMRGDWRGAGDSSTGRQFNMIRGQAAQGGQASFQVIENSAPVNIPKNIVPAAQSGTSTPNAPLK